MYEYIEALNAFIEEERPRYKCPEVNSLLRMLYRCYREHSGVNTAAVQAYFDELYALLEQATPGQGDHVICQVCKLCDAFQDQAFREGVVVGFRLYNELYSRLKHGCYSIRSKKTP